jgi:hypothetical protein
MVYKARSLPEAQNNIYHFIYELDREAANHGNLCMKRIPRARRFFNVGMAMGGALVRGISKHYC